MSIGLDENNFVIKGWPEPGLSTPLLSASEIPYEADDLKWQQGVGGTGASETAAGLVGCSIKELPRYFAKMTKKGRENGMTVVHTLYLAAFG